MNRRDEILSRIETVAAMPASTVMAMQVLNDPDADIKETSRAIELDPGLTSNLLRLVNSAYYAWPQEVLTVRQAVIRLGKREVMNLVTASGAGPITRSAVRGYDLGPGQLWEQSVAVAVATEQIALALRRQAPTHTFTAALLHDIGKVVLGSFLEVDAEPILKLAIDEEISFEVAEQRVLGIDHAEVGAALLDSWNVPSCLGDAVRWHHDPDAASGEQLVVDLVHIADALTLLAGFGAGCDGMHYRPAPGSVARLSMKAEMMEGILGEVMVKMDQLRGSLIN